MNKYLILAAVAVLTGVSAFAQNRIFNNPDNKAYFGVRVGGDIACPGKFSADNVGLKVFKNGGGVEFGGIYNIPVAANFYIEPGLKLFYNSYGVNDNFIDLIEDEIDVDINSVSFRKFGMRIPVMAGYHFDFTDDIKVSTFTGPELEVGFVDKAHISAYGFDESGSVYGDGGGFNRVNLLWNIGAGISYKNYYFGVNGGIGMLNMLSESDGVTFHENRVTFSLGYNF